ncbi:3-hydroxyisobutyrate dehydrogenase [Dongia mobilis]|uniref:3-hydroxyisobutyrate dehydrogenase n=1 Tax=Dongia mobilis TaxID=578943 RepID=A0A4R6WKU8_9PROT|nr:NAD(P)-dependent oxidoreductase [Dongia mobilis]TDQ78463.1 3-hydroxyisobutyrate dehydrogenase [Dongia mobilis]
MRYGFIGLGTIGRQLAANLQRGGFPLVVHDLHKDSAGMVLELGASWADSPRAVAEACDTVITCLPSPGATQEVLADKDGILAGFDQKDTQGGSTWIEMGTLGRDEIQRFAELAQQHGVRTLESPVTGGVHLAAQGKITILAGGDKDLFETHLPAFKAMGDRIFHMGPLGSAAVIKVITNMLAFIHLKAVGEALMLAKRGGLDLAQSYHAIAASSGNSFVHETEGQLILNGSYDIGFSMDLALKDLGFALHFGREFGVPLELASITNQTYVLAKAAYGGRAESPMIVKLLEDALRTDLRAPGFPAKLS